MNSENQNPVLKKSLFNLFSISSFGSIFLILSFLFIAVVPLGIDTVQAAEAKPSSVVLLEDYGGLGNKINEALAENNSSKALGAYIDLIVKLAFGFGSIGAVILIVWGGVEYITAQSFTSKSGGKDRLVRALGALAILFTSFIVFNQINPELLKVRFEPLSVQGTVDCSGFACGAFGSPSTGTAGLTPKEKSELDKRERRKKALPGKVFPTNDPTGAEALAACTKAVASVPVDQIYSEGSKKCFKVITQDGPDGTGVSGPGIPQKVQYEYYLQDGSLSNQSSIEENGVQYIYTRVDGPGWAWQDDNDSSKPENGISCESERNLEVQKGVKTQGCFQVGERWYYKIGTKIG